MRTSFRISLLFPIYALICAVLVITVSSVSTAETVTFDNLPASDNEITGSYEGYTWTNFGALSPAYYGYGSNGFGKGLVSGANVGFSWLDGAPSTISSSAPFDLIDGYFTAAWSESNTVTVTGYIGGVDTYVTTFNENDSGPVHETFDWSDLSSVTFLASNDGQFVVDNLTLNPSPTPEPAEFAVIGVGSGLLAGLIILRRNHNGMKRAS